MIGIPCRHSCIWRHLCCPKCCWCSWYVDGSTSRTDSCWRRNRGKRWFLANMAGVPSFCGARTRLRFWLFGTDLAGPIAWVCVFGSFAFGLQFLSLISFSMVPYQWYSGAPWAFLSEFEAEWCGQSVSWWHWVHHLEKQAGAARPHLPEFDFRCSSYSNVDGFLGHSRFHSKFGCYFLQAQSASAPFVHSF